MPVYFTTLLFLAAASLADLSRRSPRWAIGLLIAFYFIVIVGLRYNSVDYRSYWRVYDSIDGIENLGIISYYINVNTPIESGFAILILVEKYLFGHFFIFMLFLSSLSISIKYFAFKKLSPYISISFLIYFCDEYFWKDMGQVRNAIASAIVLYSFFYVYKRDFLKFSLLVFLAGYFHAFAWAAAPFYFVNLIAGRYRMAAILGLSFIIGATGGVGLVLTQLAAQLGLDPNSRFVRYASSQYVGDGRLWGGTSMLHLIISTALIFYYDKLCRVWKYNVVLIPIYICGTAIMFLFHDYGILWGRTRELLCIPAFTVILPSTILLFRGQERLVPFALILAYCLLWFFLMTRDNPNYETILLYLG